MNAYTILIIIALLLSVGALVTKNGILASVSVILICAALLATGMGWITLTPK